MKALTKNCFLALLCLFGSELYCQDTASPIKDEAPGKVTIYGEILGAPHDSVTMIFYPHFLDQTAGMPAPTISILPLRPGDFDHGALRYRVFDYQSPVFDGTGYLSLSTGTGKIMEKINVSPGDSVRIHIDLQAAQVHFSGPSAERYRCAYEMELAKAAFRKELPPVMYTGNAQKYFRDHGSTYAQAQKEASPILPLLEVVEYGETAIPYIRRILELDGATHPGWKVLQAYRGRVSASFLEIMRYELEGDLFLKKLKAFTTAFKRTPPFRELYGSLEDHLPFPKDIPPAAWTSISYMDYLFEYTNLKAIMEKQPVFDLYGSFPPPVRDQLMGRYLVKFHRRIAAPEKKFELALATVETPWISQTLSDLYQHQKTGSMFRSTVLTDLKEKDFPISDLQGKVVLMDFWFTGCKACVELKENYLSVLETKLGDLADLAMVSINTDRKTASWQRSVASGKYTTDASINLWAGDQRGQELLEHYQIRSFPTLILLDKAGRIQKVSDFPKDPALLADLIRELVDKNQ